MYPHVSFDADEFGLTVNLHEPDNADYPNSFLANSFTIQNDELAKLVNHVLGLVRKPAKPSGLKVKATGSAQYFDAFWALYPNGPSDKPPRKIAKRQMLAKWQAGNLDKEWDAIHADLNACRIDWAKDNFKYVPLVTTYVNQRRWEARKENEQPEMPLV